MKYLFGAEGEAAVATVMRREPLLAFDFDGTLAPIVALPGAAQVPLAVVQRLQRLAQRLPIAVISGRRVADVRERLQFEPRYVIGSHGAEDPSVGRGAELAPALDGLRARLRAAAAAAALQEAGVWIEDKDSSLALHYRLARDPQAALAAIERVLTDLDPGLRVFGGKMVANIVPAFAADKADALLDLVGRSGAGAAVFAGDDVNDEPVFERAPLDWLTVKVGQDAPDSRARYFINSPLQMQLMLDRLLAAVQA